MVVTWCAWSGEGFMIITWCKWSGVGGWGMPVVGLFALVG